MEIITVLFMLLAASYVASRLLKKINLPQVMGPISVGIITTAFFSSYVSEQQVDLLDSFARLGLIFLMFYVGLEIDLFSRLKMPKNLLILASSTIVVPFIITLAVTKLMGFDTIVSIILGVIMAITAEAVSIDILKELNILKTRLGETIVLVATMDNVIEILALSTLVTYIDKADMSFIRVIFNILIFLTLIYVVRFILVPYVLKATNEAKSQMFIVGTLMVLLVSVISDTLGFGELLGALLAGIVIRYTLLDMDEFKEQADMTELFEAVTFGFLAPFFFIMIGMNTDFGIIASAPSLGLLLTGLAVLTKLLGALIGYYITGQSFAEGMVFGTAMINKGVVELIIAHVALEGGLIGSELFSSLVFMAIMTTVVSPIVLGLLLKRINIS